MATGVLPVFIGRATRAAEFCENAEKEYIAGLRLGIVTDTQDITGNIISDRSVCLPEISAGALSAKDLSESDISTTGVSTTGVSTTGVSTTGVSTTGVSTTGVSTIGISTIAASGTDISADDISTVITRFLGAQKQIPPMYSAIKLNGKKLYELARRGVEVPRPTRDIIISEIQLLGSEGNDYSLRISCSKGTYIRTLCNDIGEALGCGGTMSSLRRIRAGTFTINMAHTLTEIMSAIATGDIARYILSIDSIFREYPPITLDEDETQKCKNGAQFLTRRIPDNRYRFYGPDNEFLALGEAVSGKTRIIKSFFEVH